MTAIIESAEAVEQRCRDVAAMFDASEFSQNDAGESAAVDSPANSNLTHTTNGVNDYGKAV